MDRDHMRNLVKNVDTQLFEIVSNLICPICKELFSKTVTTPCGHSFCNGCIKRVLSSKNNSGCPLCKNPVKRYGLQVDEVKSSLTKICQELPDAFEEDVKELTNNLTGNEDFIKTSKLSQLYNQDLVKESKAGRQKSTNKKRSKIANKPTPAENESGTSIPVLKRTNNVIEYASAKKKRMDDLVSISQTEPASNSSLGDSSELVKKLDQIEKIPSDKKVNEWFNAVGDNIYINSPTSSILGPEVKNNFEWEKEKEVSSTMIRRNYSKNKITQKKEEKARVITLADPYEFVPSQNNNIIKRKRKKKSVGKKIPDFKALQSFTKESVKRYSILLDESKEEIPVDEAEKATTTEKQITASQKFDQLLSESKGEQKKCHVLFTASQSSSIQLLDASFHSKAEKSKKSPKVQGKLLEEVLFKNVEPLIEEKEERRTVRSKRRRSSENVKSGKKKLFTDIMGMKNDEASQLEDSVEKYLMKTYKKSEPLPTKLGELLKELLNDDIIYATHPVNAPVRLPDLDVCTVDLTSQNQATGFTQMIGFCTQEETPDVRNFKQMVENMERELNSSAYTIDDSQNPEVEHQSFEEIPKPAVEDRNIDDLQNSEGEHQSFEEILKPAVEDRNIDEENLKIPKSLSEDESIHGEETLKVPKSQLIQFLHLGKLTPVRKRTKTTVVKLVFPIGLSSLARRRALEHGSPIASKKQTCHVSTGIQTSQHTISTVMQTSQVPQSSVNIQTSQDMRSSVEIQTTQKWTTSAEIQTSQTLVCREIQTTQIGYESAQVQTSQIDFMQKTEPPETPVRKPFHQHRKIISEKKETYPEPNPEDKDLIMDFEVEEFEDSWQNTQKHKQLVELKNKKNKEQNEKVREKSAESDNDSDIQPPKKRNSLRLFSQDSTSGIIETYETRQKIPLEVRKINEEEEMEVIDLDTSRSQNSEQQMLRVLKNIDLDLPRRKNTERCEKSEESDSDFFVEQTPPRPTSRIIEDMRNPSRSRSLLSPSQKQPDPKGNSGGTDLIGDSIPKGFSESFLLSSIAPRIPLTPEKNLESQRKTSKTDTTPTINLPDENDQNQLNAFDNRSKSRDLDPKTVQLKTIVDGWKRTEPSSPSVKSPQQKKICVAASSVKNPETIKKFVNKFKVEYLSKPTKDMTHLIVGLHENDDGEVLPLCTPKLLFAMANKKWVISETWAETCLKMNLIVPEETFETLDPVGGCGCRKARLSRELLLKNCEVYLLGEFQMISKEEFSDLITDCGGCLVSAPEKFSFLPSKLRMIIADRDCLKLNEKQIEDLYQKHSTMILSRDVIIMSVQSYKLVNLFPYLLHSATEECLIKLGYPSYLVKNEEEEEEEREDS